MSKYTVEDVSRLALYMYYKHGIFFDDTFKELATTSFKQLYIMNQNISEQLTTPLEVEKLCRTVELLEFMDNYKQEIIQHIEETKQLERFDELT